MKTIYFHSRFALLLLVLLLLFSSCKKEETIKNDSDIQTNGKSTVVFNSSLNYGTVTDIDGNIYKTIKVGKMTWMAENLRTTKYNDGTPIPNITDKEKWSLSSSGAYCTYLNSKNADTIATYGRLYNWYAVNTKKLAPKGWHVATKKEYDSLTVIYGFELGTKIREVGLTHWYEFNTNTTNESGLSIIPSGFRGIDGVYGGIGGYFFGWTSTEQNPSRAYRPVVNSISASGYYFEDTNDKRAGLAIRCLKD